MSENAEPLTIDKSDWGDGPWQTEPDRVDFIAEGFACLMLRHDHHGHWCAYVGVPSDHPAYGKEYGDVDVEFHGDLNYAKKCNDAVCHVPAPGMPEDVWWLGGHFAHCWDYPPGLMTRLKETLAELPGGLRQIYRDQAYVRDQTLFLARQLREMASA
jgi:hypothetical protein